MKLKSLLILLMISLSGVAQTTIIHCGNLFDAEKEK